MQSPDIRIDFDLRGTTVTIRTMTAVDRDIESEFVRNLSEESRYYRFHSALRELTPELLDRFTNVKYPENMALDAD
jgi:acetyltransferase